MTDLCAAAVEKPYPADGGKQGRNGSGQTGSRQSGRGGAGADDNAV